MRIKVYYQSYFESSFQIFRPVRIEDKLQSQK